MINFKNYFCFGRILFLMKKIWKVRYLFIFALSQVTYRCPGRKLKSCYLRVEGLTKLPASALVQNLSPSTYGWKDEPSHLWVPWSKFKVLLPTGERTIQATSKCLGTKFKSFYLWVEGRTKSLTSVLVKIFRSSYLQVKGPTKSLTSALVKIRSLSTYGRTDEPCHPNGPWSKFKSPTP